MKANDILLVFFILLIIVVGVFAVLIVVMPDHDGHHMKRTTRQPTYNAQPTGQVVANTQAQIAAMQAQNEIARLKNELEESRTQQTQSNNRYEQDDSDGFYQTTYYRGIPIGRSYVSPGHDYYDDYYGGYYDRRYAHRRYFDHYDYYDHDEHDLDVIVQDQDGNPVANIRVEVEGDDDDDTEFTDANGRAYFDDLEEDTYDVEVDDTAQYIGDSDDVRLTRDRTVRLTVRARQ